MRALASIISRIPIRGMNSSWLNSNIPEIGFGPQRAGMTVVPEAGYAQLWGRGERSHERGY